MVSPAIAPLSSLAQIDLGLPPLEPVPVREVPEPYRGLLAHDQDMTSTLAAFHGEAPRLRRLEADRQDGRLWRRVVLWGERSGRPLEFGQIHIDLGGLPAAGQRLVEAGRRPLGAILADLEVVYSSHLQGLFRLRADAMIADALEILEGARSEWPEAAGGERRGDDESPSRLLYGRRNHLLLAGGRLLADVIEILPPHGAAPASRP